MQQHGSKYCSRRHIATSGVGQKIKHFFLKSNMLKIRMEYIAHCKDKCQRSPTLDQIKGGKVWIYFKVANHVV